uniref:Uncharacterized protein n=1 Tax=Rhizophora mucronata TaxID=61149 RepID=A0A2P2PQ03_RHIMU
MILGCLDCLTKQEFTWKKLYS